VTTFVVDAMLGRLATWLRLVGCDAFYSAKTDDDGLLEIAQNEGRVLLTADAELSRRAQDVGIESMLLRGSVEERLAAVFTRYGIEPVVDPSKSRCSKCNNVLTEIPPSEKERVQDLVHEATYTYYDQFWLCEYCKSVFFRGGQWTNIERYMGLIAELMKKSEE
jgi:uncharacterized protein with PIN domain